jgi:hypothetical protein
MPEGRFQGLEQPDPDEPWTIHIRPKRKVLSEREYPNGLKVRVVEALPDDPKFDRMRVAFREEEEA